MSESDIIPMASCPYNKAHRLKLSRLPYHLMKCEKQYAHLGYKICFYNHSHRMPADQYLDHTKNCPDRFNFNSKPEPFINGHSDTADVPYVTGEWDAEPEDLLNAPVSEVGKIPQQQSHVYDGRVLLREHYTGAILPPSLAAIGNTEEKQTLQASSSKSDEVSEEIDKTLPKAVLLSPVKCNQSEVLEPENPEDLVKLLNMTSLIGLEVPSEDSEG